MTFNAIWVIWEIILYLGLVQHKAKFEKQVDVYIQELFLLPGEKNEKEQLCKSLVQWNKGYTLPREKA